jgi:hypothetical protein
LPAQFDARLKQILSSLLPLLVELNITIPYLNDAKTKIAPRSRDESLESGLLQLAAGTMVLVDMRDIGEGKLVDTGQLLDHMIDVGD